MAVPQRAPRYAPGCPEDNVYNGSYTFRKKRRSNIFLDLLALLIVICIGLYFWQNHSFVPENKGQIKMDITSAEHGSTPDTFYINITYTNPTSLPFYNVTATATLYGENNIVIEKQTREACPVLAGGKAEQYTFCFNSQDYTGVKYVNVSTQYKGTP